MMIYEPGASPFFQQFFEYGCVTATPNYDGSARDHAVVVEIEWDGEADEEEVSHQLETWAGLPCLEWFRFHLHDWEESVSCNMYVRVRRIVGYTDATTARGLKVNTTDYIKYHKRGAGHGR